MRRNVLASALLGLALVTTGAAQAQRVPKPDAAPAITLRQEQGIAQLIYENLFHDAASPVLGNPQGDVTMVEFFDYKCPYCKIMAPRVVALMKSDPKLRVVMKEYPILSRQSIIAAKVALVAARHGKYAAFHAAMYALPGPFDEQKVLEVARSVGLDPTIVRQEMKAPGIMAELNTNVALGEALKLQGTPSFLIGEQVVPGAVPLATLRKLVATARAKG